MGPIDVAAVWRSDGKRKEHGEAHLFCRSSDQIVAVSTLETIRCSVLAVSTFVRPGAGVC